MLRRAVTVFEDSDVRLTGYGPEGSEKLLFGTRLIRIRRNFVPFDSVSWYILEHPDLLEHHVHRDARSVLTCVNIM